MAVLTPTELTEIIPLGEVRAQVLRIDTGVASTTEWVKTHFPQILGVMGYAIHGTASATSTVAVELNSQGTGGARNSSMGDLGIITTGGEVVDIIVFGI